MSELGKTFLPLAVLFLLFGSPSQGQENTILGEYNPSNPTLAASHIDGFFDTYWFQGGDRILATRIIANYDFNHDRHMVSMNIPWLNTFYQGNFQGDERNQGLGDIKFRYMGVPYLGLSSASSFKALAFALEITAPTGNDIIGLGLGKWQYRPELIGHFRFNPFFAFYPSAKFVFTTGPVNGQGAPGWGAAPDPEDQETEGELASLTIETPAVLEVDDWDGWFTLSAIYIWEIRNSTSTWAGRLEVGKMVTPKIGLALNGTKYIGGQPLFDVFGSFKSFFFIN